MLYRPLHHLYYVTNNIAQFTHSMIGQREFPDLLRFQTFHTLPSFVLRHIDMVSLCYILLFPHRTICVILSCESDKWSSLSIVTHTNLVNFSDLPSECVCHSAVCRSFDTPQ